MYLFYRPDIDDVIERYRDWFNPNGETRYLVIIVPQEWDTDYYDLYMAIDPKNPKFLSEYNFKDNNELHEYLDYSSSVISQKYWDIKLRWNIDDDMMPVFRFRVGYADQAAAIAGVDPIYSNRGQTSYLEPIIKSYDKFNFEKLEFSEKSDWSMVLKEGLEYSLKKAKEKFLVSVPLDCSNPSDLAFQFRGKNIFLDFYDDPENTHKLLKRSAEESIKFVEYFRTIVPSIGDGYPLAWHGGVWTPDKVFSHNGDNVADQVSKSIFSDFLLPYHNKVSKHFGGCIFGREAKSEHLWSEIPKIEAIKAFAPRSMKGRYEIDGEVLKKITEKTGNLPLILESYNFDRFMQYKNIVQERGIKTIFTANCKNIGEAKEILKIVRNM
ncbi:MAG: uroporphyrinogen decarboxylase/cobalamine-independent methonine synthase family protein [Candidatus Humimicrobiaceae bacterium]